MTGYLALGSNLGDREAHLRAARLDLRELGVRVLRAGRVIETEPFGVTDQPAFLNQVLEVDWEGTPRALLEACKQAESLGGRTPSFRWGPREIDVDILWLEGVTVAEPDLVIPHPGLRVRAFFLEPLLELRPDILKT